jgi:hypothetical protein
MLQITGACERHFKGRKVVSLRQSRQRLMLASYLRISIACLTRDSGTVLMLVVLVIVIDDPDSKYCRTKT